MDPRFMRQAWYCGLRCLRVIAHEYKKEGFNDDDILAYYPRWHQGILRGVSFPSTMMRVLKAMRLEPELVNVPSDAREHMLEKWLAERRPVVLLATVEIASWLIVFGHNPTNRNEVFLYGSAEDGENDYTVPMGNMRLPMCELVKSWETRPYFRFLVPQAHLAIVPKVPLPGPL